MEALQMLRKKASNKIDITKLTRKDFEDSSLKSKYFRHDNRELDRLHLPAMTKEVYDPIAQEEFYNPKMDKANLKFETASSYYIKKAQVYVLAFDLGIDPKRLDSSNYIWNEDYYIHSNFYVNMNIVDDLFREGGDDWRESSAHTVYVRQEPKSRATDTVLWNSLYKLCYTAILTRKAMLMHKIPQCLSFLMSVLEYTNGLSENMSSTQRSVLISYADFFKNLLSDKNAAEFIKSTSDIEVFAKYEATAKDYIETYRTMLRQLVRCSGDELEGFRKELSSVEDPLIEHVLEKAIDFEDMLSEGHLENEDLEDVYEEC